ncbi:MAG: 2'-5' RNA ligase family protein [Candidatus Shapirobacteria bacterium]|nr:2'-5' RNA ligase family protein [Candidatus Shapirobacteria bacterium]MDD4410129.1 2'-5' RNA ligase family protein [Candidatus Shapirobacteria bacterium]
MKTTSHFLGITLNNKLFLGLFNSLQKYLNENNIENAIELQNINNLHITLYYFGEKIDSKTLLKVKDDLLKLNKIIFPIYIDKFNFFEKERQIYLGYLSPSKNKKIKEINSKLKSNYISDVPDNDYSRYIPHVTLFKIRDFDLYQKHSEKILKIINFNLKKIKINDSFKEINLYAVDSSFSPEKQVVVY